MGSNDSPRAPHAQWLWRVWRSVLHFAFYIAGGSLTESVLFLPTCAFLFVPSTLLNLAGRVTMAFLAAVFGEYITRDGKRRLPVSLTGQIGNRSFRAAPPHLGRALPAFPTKRILSFDNVQILQALVNLSYEDWAVVSDALGRWSAPGGSAEFLTGYSVRSVAWTDAASGQERRAELDVQVFIACINNTAVLTFRGTDPFATQDWMTDWDIYSTDAVGALGRVHPGLLVALGLDSLLQPLKGARTEVATTAADGGTATTAVLRNTLAQLLQGRLLQLANTTPISTVLVCGHSLGGALGCVFTAAHNLRARGPQGQERGACAEQPQVAGLYTVGQPRVGDAAFGRHLEACLSHSAESPTYLRLVNADDIVPAMPPAGPQDLGPTAYQHCGQLVYLSAFGGVFRQFEQPPITLGTALAVSCLAFFTAAVQFLKGLLGSRHAAAERPGVLLLAAKLVGWLGFFPHGIVQHAPANYSIAVANSKPTAWRLDTAYRGVAGEVEALVMGSKQFKAAKRRLQVRGRKHAAHRSA